MQTKNQSLKDKPRTGRKKDKIGTASKAGEINMVDAIGPVATPITANNMSSSIFGMMFKKPSLFVLYNFDLDKKA